LLRAAGVTVVPARRLPDLLWALPPVLGPERVAWLADRPGRGSAPPPDSLPDRHARTSRVAGARHRDELAALRARIDDLSRQNAALLGAMITDTMHPEDRAKEL
jgi:hypothetical protein